MNKTFVASLENHVVYLISDDDVSFYLNLLKVNDITDITMDIDYKYKNRINDVISYYEKIDNYNISLVIPYYKISNKKEDYKLESNRLSKIINMAYNFFTYKGIKVNQEINVIKHSKENDFVLYFNMNFDSRIKYISLDDLVYEQVPYNKVSAMNINFVIGKPELNLTLKDEEMQEVINETAKDMKLTNTEVSKQKISFATSGFVSYYLLGALTAIIALLVITLLMK